MRRDDLSEAVKQRLKRYPPPYDNHYGVVVAPPPVDGIPLAELTATHAAALAAMAEIDTTATTIPDSFIFNRLLQRQEALGSSAIEGTHSTLDELLRADDPEDETVTSAARQVREYAIALESLIPEARDRGQSIFDLDLIRRLHRDVMRHDPDYGDAPGEFRDRVVWIGGTGDISRSIWNPPPAEDVVPSLEGTLSYMRGEDMHMMHQSIVGRMAVAHAHFEAVHPFRDGNGRVGRLLLPLMMAAEGHVPLYLSSFIEDRKTDYANALKDAQQRGRWASMIGFMSTAVVETVAELRVTQECVANIRADWDGRRRFRRNSASARTLDLLLKYPVVTINRLAALLEVTFAQAAIAVRQLGEAGILRERTGFARNRIFAADEILTVMNRPFGSEPEWEPRTPVDDARVPEPDTTSEVSPSPSPS